MCKYFCGDIGGGRSVSALCEDHVHCESTALGELKVLEV